LGEQVKRAKTVDMFFLPGGRTGVSFIYQNRFLVPRRDGSFDDKKYITGG